MRGEKVKRIPIEELGCLCQEEETRPREQRDKAHSYCYELFREAVVHDKQMAWTLIYYQYEGLIRFWLQRQPAFPLLDEPIDGLTNNVYTRFFKALKGIQEQDFNGRFPNISAIMGFLSECARTAVLDIAKSQLRKQAEPLGPREESIAIPHNIGESLEFSEWQQALLKQIEQHLHNEKEEIIFYATYILGLKAAQIKAKYPNLLKTPTDLYQTRLRIMRRLRKDPSLKRFLD
ncbi:MAG: hypothetical protein AAF490_08200 [Chloroflexota bacterium]